MGMRKRGEARFWSRENISSQILKALSSSGLLHSSLYPTPQLQKHGPCCSERAQDSPGGCGSPRWHSCSSLSYSIASELGVRKRKQGQSLAPSSVVWWLRALNACGVVFLRGSALFCFILKPSCRRHWAAEERCPRSWRGGDGGGREPGAVRPACAVQLLEI